MIYFSTIQVWFLTTYMPNITVLGRKLDLFNEVTTVFLVDTLTVFSEANLVKFDNEGDLIFLICLFSNLVVHLFFLISSTVSRIKYECKKRRFCRFKRLIKLKRGIEYQHEQ